jgi:putative PIG3 family NAD(P)H quinone oxidoreductase
LLQRRGRYPVPPGASQILGLEVAGVIESVGDLVEGWQVGDRVCALLEGGGYAERVAVDASMLLPISENLSFTDAAALPEVFYTAYLNVFLEPELAKGETVLVHAAGSGVGTAALQLCRLFGHRVFATASAAKLPFATELGASVVIDRQTQSFREIVIEATDGRGVDVILDPVGGSYLVDNIKALAKRGRLVNIGLLGGAKAELPLGLLLTRRLRVLGSVLRSRSRAEKVEITEALRTRVWPHFATGELHPVVHCVLPIAEANEAHDLLASNATTGKVVLSIA